jgi:hypothetical protein
VEAREASIARRNEIVTRSWYVCTLPASSGCRTLTVEMRKLMVTVATAGAAMTLLACNQTGLGESPRATFSQLACLDANGDMRVNGADAADASKVPDFNADRRHDGEDAAFLQGIDIRLDPQRAKDACDKKSDTGPEYAVAHGYFDPAKVSCDAADARAVLLVGVGGGVVNIKDKADAAGIRQIIDALQKKLDGEGVQTIAVLAGPAMVGAENVHAGMEDWMTHAVEVYVDRYSCLRAILVGHSHGAVTTDVVAARLEGRYADRIIADVALDRTTVLYIGDTQTRPVHAHVINVYQTNDKTFGGAPYDAPNVDNWDASGELGPKNGDKGGALQPVTHTTIDNSKSVRDGIVSRVLRAAALPSN